MSYQLIKMVKNENFVWGEAGAPEYIQYGEAETKKAYFEEVVDATRSDLWPENLGDNYKFEHRCDPTKIEPWKADEPVYMLNATATAVDNAEVPVITGYYDFVNTPVKPVTPVTPAVQTGDILTIAGIVGIVGLAVLGLFVAISRRKKAQSKTCV